MITALSLRWTLLRGLDKVRLEWKIGAIAHNLLKITAAIVKRERMLLALG